MKDMLKITLSLVAIFVVAGLIMGLTYRYTYPVRFQAEKKEKEEALKEMAPDAADPIKLAGNWSADNKPYEYFEATSSGRPVAYIASTAGKGYSSYIKMLVSLGPDLKIRDVKILGHEETPGLGDQVEDRDHQNREYRDPEPQAHAREHHQPEKHAHDRGEQSRARAGERQADEGHRDIRVVDELP